jgi:hypothetical protein
MGGVTFDFWPLPRPMTGHWGNGPRFWERLCETFESPDVVFGSTDGIPDGPTIVDLNTGYDWLNLPFSENQFEFGYWDPPYDRLYKPESVDIWKSVKALAIYHTHVYPTSWFPRATRVGMIATTMGPLKAIRLLQVFEKSPHLQLSLAPKQAEE